MKNFHETSDAVRLEHERIKSLARGLVRSTEDAEDLAQDAWLASLTTAAEQVRNREGWLRRMLRYRAIRIYRERELRSEYESRVAEDRFFDSSPLERDELARIVRTALAKVRQPYRGVIELRYLEGMTPKEISTRLARPLPTVKSQLARGLRELRGDLDPDRAGWRRRLGAVFLLPMPSRPRSGTSWLLGPAAITAGLVGVVLLSTAWVRTWNDAGVRPTELARPAHSPEVVVGALEPLATRRAAVTETPGWTAHALPKPGFITLAGRVSVGGAPAPDAELWVAPARREDLARRVAVTDAQGDYSGVVVERTSWISARSPRAFLNSWTSLESPRYARGGHHQVDFALETEPRRVIAFRVVEPDGSPTGPVTLEVVRSSQPKPFLHRHARLEFNQSRTVLEFDSGRFDLLLSAARRVTLRFRSERGSVLEHDFDPRLCGDELSVQLEPKGEPAATGLGRIAGRAVDANGAPLAGWLVRSPEPHEHPSVDRLCGSYHPGAEVLTDARGGYAIDGVNPGRSVYLYPPGEGGGEGGSLPLAAGRSGGLLRVASEEERSRLEARVGAGDGLVVLASEQLERDLYVTPGGAGTVVFPSLLAGDYRMYWWGVGEQPFLAATVQLAEGVPVDLGWVDTAARARVDLLFKSREGQLIRPDKVFLIRNGVRVYSKQNGIEVAADGRHIGASLRPGTYQLFVRHHAYVSERFECVLEPGKTFTQDVEMTPGVHRTFQFDLESMGASSIRFEFLDDQGAVVQRAGLFKTEFVSLMTSAQAVSVRATTSEGQVEVVELEAQGAGQARRVSLFAGSFDAR